MKMVNKTTGEEVFKPFGTGRCGRHVTHYEFCAEDFRHMRRMHPEMLQAYLGQLMCAFRPAEIQAGYDYQRE